jgi:hypothetical protein
LYFGEVLVRKGRPPVDIELDALLLAVPNAANSSGQSYTIQGTRAYVSIRFRRQICYTGYMSIGEILNGILDPITECLTAQAARKILDFHPDAATQNRVDALAAMADAGRLSDAERAEYHDYVEAFDLVAFMKSKAREVLYRH